MATRGRTGSSGRVARRIAAFVVSAGALTACLMSIDESKLDSKPGDDGGETSRLDSSSTVRDAEPAKPTDDGGLACSEGLTLCADNVCYDTTGDLERCGSCTNKCAESEVCRNSKCVLPGSCKELLARVPGTSTGIQNLSVDGTVLPVYCDMTTAGGGFTLVFRLSQGIPGDPYGLFKGPSLNDDVATEVTPLVRPVHYVSRLLADWNAGLSVTDARVRLYDVGGDLLRELTFNGAGSTRDSWFSKPNLTGSPWSDVNAADGGASTNVFSPMGHYDERRCFFITRPYKTCPEDEGWLVVHGTKTNPACPSYENPSSNVRIFYAPESTAQRWSVAVPEAASFAIFVR